MKKTTKGDNNSSKVVLTRIVKKKRGVKRGEDIQGAHLERNVLGILLLEISVGGNIGVDPEVGLATSEHFVAEREMFVTKSGKPPSFSTVKGDFTEILRKFLKKITNSRKEK